MTTFPYLGTAGPATMLQLPSPNAALDAPVSRGETLHTLMSGATAKTQRLHGKKTFSLPYSSLYSTDADLLTAFYLGLFGDGPFVFVDPTVNNVLSMDVSTLGLRAAANLDWIQSAGTLTRSATGGPAGLTTGVVTWSSLSASATLQPGLVANTANIAKAPAYIAGEPFSVSLYVKASGASSMSLQLTGYDAAGAVLVASAATTVAATTSWKRFTVSIPAGAAAFASCYYVLPRLVLGGSVPTSVSVAAAQAEYSASASLFQIGYGAPRVQIMASPGRSVPQFGYADATLVLAEV